MPDPSNANLSTGCSGTFFLIFHLGGSMSTAKRLVFTKQTVGRQPLFSLNRLSIAGIFAIAMMSFASPLSAQWTDWTAGFPRVTLIPLVPNPLNIGREHVNGLVGIGPFVATIAAPAFEPKRMLHIHSTPVVEPAQYYPAFLRLQTQVANDGVNNVNQFGQAGVEFMSGSTLNGGAGAWCTGKIVGIANGQGINPTGTPLFQPGTGNIDLQGGLAFYCSPSAQLGLPDETSAIEVMRIINGKLGVGTTNPQADVQINSMFGFHGGGSSVMSHNAYFDGSTWKCIAGSAGDKFPVNIEMWNGSYQVEITDHTTPLAANSAITWKTALQIGYTGNVGVGVQWAGSRLVVKGEDHTSSHSALNVADDNYASLLFVRNDGKVGIGTDSPGSMLDIKAQTSGSRVAVLRVLNTSGTEQFKVSNDGYVLSQEFKVALQSGSDWTWPDYVFAKDYKLSSLVEVEQYINDNGHLPGIPSAEQLQNNGGIELGKMQAKLTEKIEELTLYMIEMKKENKDLQTKLNTLQQKLEERK